MSRRHSLKVLSKRALVKVKGLKAKIDSRRNSIVQNDEDIGNLQLTIDEDNQLGNRPPDQRLDPYPLASLTSLQSDLQRKLDLIAYPIRSVEHSDYANANQSNTISPNREHSHQSSIEEQPAIEFKHTELIETMERIIRESGKMILNAKIDKQLKENRDNIVIPNISKVEARSGSSSVSGSMRQTMTEMNEMIMTMNMREMKYSQRQKEKSDKEMIHRLQEENERLNSEHVQNEKSHKTAKQRLCALEFEMKQKDEECRTLQAQVDVWTSEKLAVLEVMEQAQAEMKELAEEKANLIAANHNLDFQVISLTAELQTLKGERDKALTRTLDQQNTPHSTHHSTYHSTHHSMNHTHHTSSVDFIQQIEDLKAENERLTISKKRTTELFDIERRNLTGLIASLRSENESKDAISQEHFESMDHLSKKIEQLGEAYALYPSSISDPSRKLLTTPR